jgi:hypothetical protein
MADLNTFSTMGFALLLVCSNDAKAYVTFNPLIWSITNRAFLGATRACRMEALAIEVLFLKSVFAFIWLS